MTKTIETKTPEVRLLSDAEVKTITGGEAVNPFANTGCIRINHWGPMPSYNPWLDPYSPERRQA